MSLASPYSQRHLVPATRTATRPWQCAAVDNYLGDASVLPEVILVTLPPSPATLGSTGNFIDWATNTTKDDEARPLERQGPSGHSAWDDKGSHETEAHRADESSFDVRWSPGSRALPSRMRSSSWGCPLIGAGNAGLN